MTITSSCWTTMLKKKKTMLLQKSYNSQTWLLHKHLQPGSTEDLDNHQGFKDATQDWHHQLIKLVDLMWDMVTISCSVPESSFYPIRHFCKIVFSLGILELWPWKCFVRSRDLWTSYLLIPESKWTLVPNLKELPWGIPGISYSQEWDGPMKNQKTLHILLRLSPAWMH